MSMSDPIADYLSRVRNAVGARKRWVDIPASNLKIRLSEILKENNYVRDFKVIEDNKQNVVRVYLKYVEGESSISGIERISTPGLRNYVNKDNLPRVLNGLGIAIISTSHGVMTDKQARREAVGGEVLCHVW